MKKTLITAIAAISAAIAMATTTSRTIDARSNNTVMGTACKIVAASGSGQFRLEIGRQFDFGGTIVSSKNVIFGGSYSSNISNITFSAPIYVSPSDRIYCSGVNATNFTAQAILFIEQ